MQVKAMHAVQVALLLLSLMPRSPHKSTTPTGKDRECVCVCVSERLPAAQQPALTDVRVSESRVIEWLYEPRSGHKAQGKVARQRQKTAKTKAGMQGTDDCERRRENAWREESREERG